MQRKVRFSPRLVAALVVLAGAGAILAMNLTAADPASRTNSGASEAVLVKMPIADRFAQLASTHSNRCNLAAGELGQMPARMRLQGSCCFPMELGRYKQQLRDLSAFRRSRAVPRDPYNVSVGLAKRLLQYRTIALSPQQRGTYRRATKLSSLGGPCCCPCWRWQAFKGQANFLIARRHYSATRVANLWELEEGCGGPASA